MFRLLAALLGLAVLGAIFAGIYYAPENHRFKEDGVPAFNPAAGDVRSFGVQPTVRGSPIQIEVHVLAGVVDVYLMEKEWAASLPVPGEGRLGLERPFSFHAEHSAVGVNGTWTTTLVSDGTTWHTLVIDNSDNYYANDTVPQDNETARVQIVTRYLDQERRSLVLGYLAVLPCALLVLVTLGRQAVRWRRERRARRAPAALAKESERRDSVP